MKVNQVFLDTNELVAAQRSRRCKEKGTSKGKETALSEEISAFKTKKYLEDRAKRGSRKKFMEALAKVPNAQPEESDKL